VGVAAQATWGHSAAHGKSYIAADYVKFIEAAGGRVVPIPNNATDEYVTKMFHYINGFLLPGGATSVYRSGYERTAKIMLNLAMQAYENGDYFPIWGTCLGFEQLAVLVAGNHALTNCSAWDVSLPLELNQDFRDSRMFHKAPEEIINILKSQSVTANYHHECVSWKNWFSSNGEHLQNMFKVLSSNSDVKGLKFISTIEGKTHPIFATQWHPEKNMFAWRPNLHVAHSEDAIKISQYMANFFVGEARKNMHHFPSREAEMHALIYNFNPVYSGLQGSEFEQKYYF
ncbi:uncharacterized protein TRIADDRAFT_34071, partial [Trichoplax adhaerens]